MKLLIRTATWLLIAAVTFATLGPPRYRPMTDIGQDGEHALAFILVGLALGMAYPRRPLIVAIVAVGMTGIVELLQMFAPGRHARLEDFLVDALTLLAGLAAVAGVQHLVQRRHVVALK